MVVVLKASTFSPPILHQRREEPSCKQIVVDCFNIYENHGGNRALPSRTSFETALSLTSENMPSYLASLKHFILVPILQKKECCIR
jgi:hypothetical protein